MTTHKTYRKEVRTDSLHPWWREEALHPVRRDSDDSLSWDHFDGFDAGFVCWCGESITSFSDAVALAED